MKQELSLPFEKNKYFYGKLLSVEDFELEQRYGNDKRRLMNRLIHGTGIVTGLYVTVVDEQTISVEKGVALDSAGREILVNTPVLKKLSMLDGFEECMESKEPVYLCLVYNETPIVPVHNISKNVPDAKEENAPDFGRIKEDYRLYLTNMEPKKENLSSSALVSQVITVYKEDGIRIRHRMPRYVQAGQTVSFTVEIESRDRSNLSFSYDLLLKGVNWEGLNRASVQFDEVMFEKTGKYELNFSFTAADVSEGKGIVTVDSDTIQLCLSSKEKPALIGGKMEVQIGALSEKDALLQNYYQMAMEEIISPDDREPLYLAKLYLVTAGDTYMIDQIERVPYGQYVRNLMLQQALDKMILDGESLKDENKGILADSRVNKHEETNSGVLIRSGCCSLTLREGGQKGEIYYSEEISHGLGLGKTVLQLGLGGEQQICYGSSGVFDGKKQDVLLAAKLNMESGTFVIGAKVLSAITNPKLNIQWTAIRDKKDTIMEQADMRIFIKPSVLELKVLESFSLEAQCENMIEKSIIWSVSEGGGYIDSNGMYTAPDLPGVYEVTVKSAAYNNVAASLFVVVRDYEVGKV